jgi:hypothetical protein
MMNLRRIAENIKTRAEKMGWDIDQEQIASTNTRYITLSRDASFWITIRIGDHADAYATSDYTIDGVEGSYRGAIDFLKRAATPEGQLKISRAENKRRYDAQQAKIDRDYDSIHLSQANRLLRTLSESAVEHHGTAAGIAGLIPQRKNLTRREDEMIVRILQGEKKFVKTKLATKIAEYLTKGELYHASSVKEL